MSILYLHGFASSPHSRKAVFFSEKLRAAGFRVEIPDLAQSDFEHLTLRRQLNFIEDIARGRDVILIGSSLGGYLASLYAARHLEAKKVLLLAPAFGFRELWIASLGPERLAEWKARGVLNVFHYGEGRELPLAYEFLEDSRGLDPFPVLAQPVLIFHGTRDSVVPIEQSLAFVRLNPQAKLVPFNESGHELTDVLDQMWSAAEDFLFGTAA